MNAPARSGLRVLVIDDERPALDELTFLLESDERIAEVHATDSPTDALRMLQQLEVDAVFLDIRMPGLSGIDLAQVISLFRYAASRCLRDRSRAACRGGLRAERGRLRAQAGGTGAPGGGRTTSARRRPCRGPRGTGPVERGGVTRFVPISQIRYVEAEGDYARLHTADDSHLVRVPLTQLEQDWSGAGFFRIHRSILIATSFVDEIRVDGGRCSVMIDGHELQVSRRHTRELRDLLVRNARPGTESRT